MPDNSKPTSLKVRTRFAPSPTGYMHIGSLRTALFCYLYSRQNKGDFILRIEDTDQARFIEGAIEKIVALMHEMGLEYDEGVAVQNGKLVDKGAFGPYQQSKRKAIYKEYAEQLVKTGHAYYCFCDETRLLKLRKEQEARKIAPQYDKHCRFLSSGQVKENLEAGMPFVIRQAIPENSQVTVKDLVYKEIVIDTKTLDDQVLLKSDGFPTYHLAVVVDDHLMQITHVIRGEEWIPSTPKHLLLYKAFNWDPPKFAHLPLILNKDRSKLSKRQGDVAVEDYLAKGYLKEALINFVALLGWNPKTDQEVFSLDELTAQFGFEKVNRAGAVFDLEKLDWLNGTYIRKLNIKELATKTIPYLEQAGLVSKASAHKEGSALVAGNGKEISMSVLEKIIKLEQERLKKLSEIGERVKYFFEKPEYAPQLIIWKKSNLEQTRKNLSALYEFLKILDEQDFSSAQNLEDRVKKFISDSKLDNGSVLWPMRAALSGMEASPGPFDIAAALYSSYGKQEILDRISTALEKLE